MALIKRVDNPNDRIYTNPEYLKMTYRALVDNPSNVKLVQNIKMLFEHIDIENAEHLAQDARVFIEMIQKALSGIDTGLRNKIALFDYSADYPDYEPVVDLRHELVDPLPNHSLDLVRRFIEHILLNKPIFNKSSRLAELAVTMKGKGLHNAIHAMDEFKKELDSIKRDMDKITTGKTVNELIIDGDESVGLDRIATERENESNVILKLFGALNLLFGGGARLRTSSLFIGNTGCFKSGLLLNLMLYIKEYAELPDTFLAEGELYPAVLYITHENTMTQTCNRVLAWHGYSKADIDAMNYNEWKEAVNKACAPGKNGIRIIIKYIEPDTITVQDLDKLIQDKVDSGYKIIACAEDYIKHVKAELTQGEINDNKQTADKIAIQCSALARKHFMAFFTASQFGREGNRVKEEAKDRGGLDYLKKLNTSYIAGVYNTTNSYENIFLIDRGIVPNTRESFFVIKQVKDRDGLNDTGDDYYVIPFEKGGFKLSPDKYYKSVADMDPTISNLTDIYNVALIKAQENAVMQESLMNAREELRNAGYDDESIGGLADIDLLTRAQHIRCPNIDKINEAKMNEAKNKKNRKDKKVDTGQETASVG